MAYEKYIWRADAGLIELSSTQTDPNIPAVVLYSGWIEAGQEIPAALDPNHPVVASWLAFKMIEEVAVEAPSKPSVKLTQKEPSNG